MSSYPVLLACLLLTAFSPVFALRQEVLSSFVFTRYGDRTPLYTSDSSILTPYGATQMYNAGSILRDRYLTTGFGDGTTNIRDIAHYLLNADEVSIMSTDHQYVVASAQAFMQGLYPPLGQSSTNFTNLGEMSQLANGTNVIAPLNGYNYADISTVSSYDPRSVWLDGSANCPAYVNKLVEYYNTTDFDFLYTISLDFYRSLDVYLDDYFTPNDLGYYDAYYIYDWLQYEVTHNASFAAQISAVNMTRAKIFAADWVQAMYSNSTDSVKSIAGRSLASQVLNTFYTSITTQGSNNKLNLWFGDYAPMVSIAALMGLTRQQSEIFYQIPEMSGSYIFELIAYVADDDSGVDYPDTSDMYVRFLYQNGTDAYSRMTEYSLFGRSPSSLISYTDFVTSMSKISLSGITEWCNTCQGVDDTSIFCPAFTDNEKNLLGRSKRKGLSPVVAGVIGALVALAAASLLFALLMLLAGLRIRREGGRKKTDLGGFKGSAKLASDQDLTLPKGSAGATVVTTEPESTKSHERVGSWELRAKEQDAGLAIPKARRPSYEDDEIHVDPYAPAVKPHDQV